MGKFSFHAKSSTGKSELDEFKDIEKFESIPEILVPICVHGNGQGGSTEQDIRNLINELNKQSSGKKIVIILADSLDRHNRNDEKEEEAARKAAVKEGERIHAICLDALTEINKSDYEIKHWDDYLYHDDGKKALQIFTNALKESEGKNKIANYINRLADQWTKSKEKETNDKGSELSLEEKQCIKDNSRKYLIEEFAMILSWRTIHPKSVLLYDSKYGRGHRFTLLKAVNKLPIDSASQLLFVSYHEDRTEQAPVLEALSASAIPQPNRKRHSQSPTHGTASSFFHARKDNLPPSCKNDDAINLLHSFIEQLQSSGEPAPPQLIENIKSSIKFWSYCIEDPTKNLSKNITDDELSPHIRLLTTTSM